MCYNTFSFLVICFEDDIDYRGYDINKHPNNAYYAKGAGKRNSAKECQQLCQQEASCKFFTHHISKKECWLKTRSSSRRQNSGSTSGPKTCSEGIFQNVFLLQHDFNRIFRM